MYHSKWHLLLRFLYQWMSPPSTQKPGSPPWRTPSLSQSSPPWKQLPLQSDHFLNTHGHCSVLGLIFHLTIIWTANLIPSSSCFRPSVALHHLQNKVWVLEYSFSIFNTTFCDLVPAHFCSLIFCRFSSFYWITLSCVLSFSSLTLLQNSARHPCFRVRCFSSLLPKHLLYTAVLTVWIVIDCSYSPHPIPLHCGSSAVGIVLFISVFPMPDTMPGPQ